VAVSLPGQKGETAVPGDYDGDGMTDVATWNPGTGVWTANLSSAGGKPTNLGKLGGGKDVPVPIDFDGDGKTDLATWSGGKWSIIPSSTKAPTSVTLQNATDTPLPSLPH
jgi:hypothetical protein